MARSSFQSCFKMRFPILITRFLLLPILGCCLGTASFLVAEDALLPSVELSEREGLPHFFQKIQQGESITVAYLGGSITAATGWRVKSLQWLTEKYPSADFSEVNAAIGGTGSDLGAFRVKQDVIDHEPDLVFVEFAVNDGGTDPTQIQRTMEGIVRQIWAADPSVDICFVYTLSEPVLANLMAKQFQRSATAMEVVAGHYGIPSIHFGVEVARRVAADELIFKGTKEQAMAPDGKPVFAVDGVHPTDAGHQIYQEVLERSLLTLTTSGQARERSLAAFSPLHEDNWEHAKIIPVSRSMLKGEWHEVQPGDALNLSRFRQRLPQIWSTSSPGASLEFTLEGNLARVYDLVGPDGGMLAIQIDDEAPRTVARFDSYSTYHRLSALSLLAAPDSDRRSIRVSLLPSLPDKASILKDKASEMSRHPQLYKERAWHIGSILVLGDVPDTEGE